MLCGSRSHFFAAIFYGHLKREAKKTTKAQKTTGEKEKWKMRKIQKAPKSSSTSQIQTYPILITCYQLHMVFSSLFFAFLLTK